MTNLTVSTDYFDPSVYRHVPKPSATHTDGGFVLIRECIPRPTALISCTPFSRGPREAIQDGAHRRRDFFGSALSAFEPARSNILGLWSFPFKQLPEYRA
jgi:hypothetical protein